LQYISVVASAVAIKAPSAGPWFDKKVLEAVRSQF
jgi:hypothetical protein